GKHGAEGLFQEISTSSNFAPHKTKNRHQYSGPLRSFGMAIRGRVWYCVAEKGALNYAAKTIDKRQHL
ncbi:MULTISPECIES: hypothetical protein, partial [unclassified Oscillibacter]|uniref:hypothetical protein n=1 Tax=unclassified Oscillibacter TaxID=2629304 RepID=UPI001A980D0C